MTNSTVAIDARQKLENLTDALVDDILRAPDEEVLLEELGARFERLREERDFLRAQLAGERRNIAGWIAARDANLQRAELAERQLDESLAGHRQKAEAFDAIRLLAGEGMDDPNLETTAAGYLQRISVIADRRAALGPK